MAGVKWPVSCGEMFMKFNILLPDSEYSLFIIICCRQIEKTLQFKHIFGYNIIYIILYIYNILTRQGYDLHMPNTNLTVRSLLQ